MDIKLEKGAVQICRICLQDVGLDYPILYLNCAGSENSSVTIKDKLIECVPELNLDTVPNAIICNECSIVLSSAYSFKLKCLRTEMQIKKYLQQMNATTLLDLTEVQHMDVVNRSIKVEEVVMPDFKMEVDDGSSNGSALVDDIHFKISTEDVLKADCYANSDYTDMCEYVTESNSDLSLHVETPADMQDMEDAPQEAKESAVNAKKFLLPTKSKELYEEEYNAYRKWCLKMKINKTTEDSILVYFNTNLASCKSSTLWSKYSRLRSTIGLKESVDISKFPSIIPFLKRKAEGYTPKKSLTLTKENLDTFLTEADDKHHLLNKVILIFGIFGACRRQELASLLITNVQDCQTRFVVKLNDSKTKTERSFIILPGKIGNLNLLEIIRSYIALRSPKTSHNRFFVNYIKEKCTVQPVGVHKIAGVPAVVAKFLNLENHTLYTGHCFRRTSATLLANAGATIDDIKRHGGWRSVTVARGYVDASVKKNVASQILGNEYAGPSISSNNINNKEN